jgi:hypothetical protein
VGGDRGRFGLNSGLSVTVHPGVKKPHVTRFLALYPHDFSRQIPVIIEDEREVEGKSAITRCFSLML